MRILQEEDVESLVVGAAILGTGGGGDPDEGLTVLRNDLERGRRLAIVGLAEVPDDALLVSPYFCGSIAPVERLRKARVFEDPLAVALKRMEEAAGRKVGVAIASELGGLNTAMALHAASLLGLPLADGDLLGRAGPELHQCTAHLFDVPVVPAVVVSQSGNVAVIEKYADVDEYEALVRSMAVVAGGFVAVVDTPISGLVAKQIAVRDTVSKCIEVGRAVKEANSLGVETLPSLLRCLDGVLLFRGIVKQYRWEDRGGFLYGTALYEGLEEWAGSTLKIWIKNENIVAWLDDGVAATAPDLICVVDDKGYPVTNARLREGTRVAVIGVKAPSVWLTEKGLELFGPRHFGFDFEYAPMKR